MKGEDEVSHIFYSSIHGSIEMPAFAVAVIDTPQFQRLREIKVKSFFIIGQHVY